MSHFVAGGALILTGRDARMLCQGAKIAELRMQNRVGDSDFYALLTDIYRLSLAANSAVPGIEPRQSAALDEADFWTVKQVADAAGLAPRTVRLDCSRELLPAEKAGSAWLISASEARTYIDRRHKN